MFSEPALRSIFFIFAVFASTTTPCTNPKKIVENIILDSNGSMDIDEFVYLTDINIGTTCDEEQIIKAHEILGIKKQFKRVSLTSNVNPQTNNLVISCIIEPNIILKKVKIRGILTNKTQYEHLYSLQAGEIFSQADHTSSMKAIQEKLHTEGCLNGQATANIKKDVATKTVTVVITIDTGPRFFIHDIKYILKLPNATKKTLTRADIHESLKNIFNPMIHRYQYTQTTIKYWTKKIKENLVRQGFLNPMLQMKIVANKTTRRVSVVFIITISTPKFIIQGNRHASQQELLSTLLSNAGQTWGLKHANIRHQLKMHYQSKGFWKTKIEITQEDDRIIIKIEEDSPLNISQIIIHDAEKKPLPNAIMLLTKINSTTRCTNSFIKSHLQRIVKAASKQGFWDFKIKRTKILIPKSNPLTCTLNICVIPGQQRILEAVSTIIPTDKFSQFKASGHPESYKNTPFDPQIIATMRRTLLNSLYQNGYWYASVDCELKQTSSEAKKSCLSLIMNCKINPGDQVFFGKIITQGYSKLPFKQIIKNCPFPEGSLWDQKKVDSARSRLHQLGIFEHVQLTPHQLAQHKSPKHIIANILDDDPYEARLKIGFFASSDAPFLNKASAVRLAGTYLVKNPLNKADIFSITAQADANEQQLSTQYNVPDMLGSNQLNSVLLITENHRYMLNLCEPAEAVLERRSGLKVSAYQPLTLNQPQFGWSAGIDHSKLLDHYGNMNLDTSLTEKSLFFVYFAPIYKKISIDERKTMSEGLETNAELKLSFPLVSHGNSPAIRFLFRQRFAKNLHRKVGFIITFRCGHLFSDGDFSSIHPTDRFYLGGADSVRGYSKDTLPPLGTYITKAATTGYTVQGGRGMMQANLELRYRVSRNAELQAFHDMGALSQDSIHELFIQRYRTVGIGTRLYTPVGIIKFDIGWKLNLSYPEEHSYNWHLSFDGSF